MLTGQVATRVRDLLRQIAAENELEIISGKLRPIMCTEGLEPRRGQSRKEALDDAISATKAAVAEGIVPGGGLALLRCIDAVAQEETKCEGDEKTGVQILKRALEAPTRQIAENSAVDGGVVVARMLGGQGNYGFDASRNEYVDLVEAGIIDPTKVLRIALENAVSVASVLLLTEATMTEIPEPSKERPGPELAY